MHFIMDSGQLCLTVGILRRKLGKYKPAKLGWFDTKLWPVWNWLTPVLISTLAFPILIEIAKQAQVIPHCLTAVAAKNFDTVCSYLAARVHRPECKGHLAQQRSFMHE